MGYQHENDQLNQHSQPPISFGAYLVSPEFGEAVFENRESEFLQMAALVILTIWLKQKGSADSKKLRGSTWQRRARGARDMIYSNSLSIALIFIFIISFMLHGTTGLATANEEAMQHGQSSETLVQYMTSSQFWFESFQNWQSEFLAVASLLILSIFLRQRGSPESKPIAEKNATTG